MMDVTRRARERVCLIFGTRNISTTGEEMFRGSRGGIYTRFMGYRAGCTRERRGSNFRGDLGGVGESTA